ncbi:hypothetical protein ACFPL7_05805 [Dongia soli]|uniref:Tail fiber protein n=1 Tax=Dongia soli TaxID=600628 RepID=A0ABU5EHP8_9PROT|nr:hypothetical protein [Dongia soli]MDY0884916.1 hypothetical protein [Dongia soli]
MTIQTTSSKAGPFIGNGSATTFASNFLVDKPDDLVVIYTNALAQDTTLDPSQYTATGFGDPGGVTITYPISGPPIGANEKITLLRMVDYDQQTSITNQGGFYPTVIEKALDRIVMQCQQLAEKVGRAISVSVSSNEDPNEAFQSIAINAAIAQEAAAEAGGSANAAAASAAAAAESAASIEKPIPVVSGGTGAESSADARTNLGLGTAATQNIGTAAGDIPQLQTGGKMPAVSAEDMTMTGRLLRITKLTASGVFTKVTQLLPQTNFVGIWVYGGGAGGGGVRGLASNTAAGGNGGAGGYAFAFVPVSALAATEIIQIGSGGAAGPSTPNDGGSGGVTSFGAFASATGGESGGVNNASSTGAALCRGGVGIVGDVLGTGDSGCRPFYVPTGILSQPPGAGTRGKYGAAGLYGAYAGGFTTGNNAPPNSGCGGMGGISAFNNTGTAAGGPGGSGFIMIEEYA